MRQFLLYISIFAALASGCVPHRMSPVSRAGDGGELYLYLQPLRAGIDGLRFTLESVAAVREDGSEISLVPRLQAVDGGVLETQRLVVQGILPPGEYRGLIFKAKNALLSGSDGEAALLAGESALSPVPFRIENGKALLLTATLRPRESVSPGFVFTPVFSVVRPPFQGSGLVGIVSLPVADAVILFDKQTLQATGVIATGRGPAGVALDQRNRRAYVALSGEDAVDVIDIAISAVARRIHLQPGDVPEETAVARDGKLLLTVNSGSSSMSFIDTSSGIETRRIRLGNGAGPVVTDPAGKRAYVLNRLSETISVVDLATQREVAAMSVGASPSGAAFGPGGDALYVVSAEGKDVIVLDPASLAVKRRIFVGPGMEAVRVDGLTGLVYGARRLGAIEIFDPSTFVSLEAVRTGGQPTRMIIAGEENNLLAVDAGGKRVVAVNLVARRAGAYLETGDVPHSVAAMGER